MTVSFRVSPPRYAGDRPCKVWQDVEFSGKDDAEAGKEAVLRSIRFRNYYCAAITVKQRLPASPSTEGWASSSRESESGARNGLRWKTVLKSRRLMRHPHYENDAQDWHELHVGEFSSDFEPSRVMKEGGALRFYLEQPSNLWKEFELQKFSFDMESEREEAAGGGGKHQRSAGAAAVESIWDKSTGHNSLFGARPRAEVRAAASAHRTMLLQQLKRKAALSECGRRRRLLEHDEKRGHHEEGNFQSNDTAFTDRLDLLTGLRLAELVHTRSEVSAALEDGREELRNAAFYANPERALRAADSPFTWVGLPWDKRNSKAALESAASQAKAAMAAKAASRAEAKAGDRDVLVAAAVSSTSPSSSSLSPTKLSPKERRSAASPSDRRRGRH